MKVIKTIISYILTIILALAILAFVMIHLASSYVLNESYILAKLEEQNYYDEIYEELKSNFEKYIYQSGFSEDVLDDIVSKEKVKKDTKTIISNIYDGLDEEIEVQTIKDNLNKKIEDSFGRKYSKFAKKTNRYIYFYNLR